MKCGPANRQIKVLKTITHLLISQPEQEFGFVNLQTRDSLPIMLVFFIPK